MKKKGRGTEKFGDYLMFYNGVDTINGENKGPTTSVTIAIHKKH